MARDIPTEEELHEARHEATEAHMLAGELEGKARRARRTASAKMKHYEDLVLIAQGQLTIPLEEAT